MSHQNFNRSDVSSFLSVSSNKALCDYSRPGNSTNEIMVPVPVALNKKANDYGINMGKSGIPEPPGLKKLEIDI